MKVLSGQRCLKRTLGIADLFASNATSQREILGNSGQSHFTFCSRGLDLLSVQLRKGPLSGGGTRVGPRWGRNADSSGRNVQSGSNARTCRSHSHNHNVVESPNRREVQRLKRFPGLTSGAFLQPKRSLGVEKVASVAHAQGSVSVTSSQADTPDTSDTTPVTNGVSRESLTGEAGQPSISGQSDVDSNGATGHHNTAVANLNEVAGLSGPANKGERSSEVPGVSTSRSTTASVKEDAEAKERQRGGDQRYVRELEVRSHWSTDTCHSQGCQNLTNPSPHCHDHVNAPQLMMTSFKSSALYVGGQRG
jgi:hypothetical protein